VKTHPYAEAVYEVVSLGADGFGVKVSVPDANPTMVSRFPTEAAAEAWVASHKTRVQAQSQPRTIFRRSAPAATTK
jgi:hypothetical protein